MGASRDGEPTGAAAIAIRLGLWAMAAAAAGAGAAYALRKRHGVNVFEKKFDPDAELMASRIPNEPTTSTGPAEPTASPDNPEA